jgi:hypothetical protein
MHCQPRILRRRYQRKGAPIKAMGDTEAKKKKQFAILVQNNDPGALETVKILKQALEDNVKA